MSKSSSCAACGADTLLPDDTLSLASFSHLRDALTRHLPRHVAFSARQIARSRKWSTLDTSETVDFETLKRLMERLGVPRTHLDMKSVANRADSRAREREVTLKEFILLYTKISDEDVVNGPPVSLYDMFLDVDSIDVSTEGIPTTVNFFEAKIAATSSEYARRQAEIRREKELRERQEAEKAARKQEFQSKMAIFNNNNK